MKIMESINERFEIKNNQFGAPTQYLGAGILKYQLGNGNEVWSMDSNQYVKEIVETVKALLDEDDRDLKTCKRRTHSGHYQPITSQSSTSLHFVMKNSLHIIVRLSGF